MDRINPYDEQGVRTRSEAVPAALRVRASAVGREVSGVAPVRGGGRAVGKTALNVCSTKDIKVCMSYKIKARSLPGLSLLCRTGCLVLALVAVANQQVMAEDAAVPATVKPAEAVVPPPETPAVPAPSEAVVTPAAPVAKGFFDDYPIHGFLKSRYKARWTEGARDHDLYETLSLDAGDADRNRVTAHFLGDLAYDLDGHIDNRGNYPFDSIRDTSGTNAVAKVYSAYADLNRIGPVAFIRAGRQSIYETPEISFFDGLRAETQELGENRLKVGLYGGVPVRLYQGYTATDRVAGVYGEGHLWQGSRARVDYQHLEGTVGSEEIQNNLVGLGGWQRIGRYVDLHAHYTFLDEEGRDMLLRGTFTQPDWDLRFQGSYFEQLKIRQNAVVEADAYYPILKDYLPYREYRWMLSKGIGEYVNVHGGMDLRRLSENETESAFNHQYNRYFATLDLLDLVVKGSSVSMTEEKWVSQDRSTDSQGLDVTCPVGEKNKVSVGTAHYLYKYDYYADAERTDVQTYYMKLVHRYSKALRLSLNYTLEDERSSANYNEVRCEALCSF